MDFIKQLTENLKVRAIGDILNLPNEVSTACAFLHTSGDQLQVPPEEFCKKMQWIGRFIPNARHDLDVYQLLRTDRDFRGEVEAAYQRMQSYLKRSTMSLLREALKKY